MRSHHHLFHARVYFETSAPLAIASGKEKWSEDQPVILDYNGLPFLPATSLIGSLRNLYLKLYGPAPTDLLFGAQNPVLEQASLVKASPAILVGNHRHAFEGLLSDEEYRQATSLSGEVMLKRDRVRINHRGVVDGSGKFDRSSICAGVRFVFDLSMESPDPNDARWGQLLSLLHHDFWRLGANTRSGFGQIKIQEVKQRVFKADSPVDQLAYAQWSYSFNHDLPAPFEVYVPAETTNSDTPHYVVSLTPKNFFLFSSGKSGTPDEADINPKTEKRLTWNNNQYQVSKKEYLIPASSVKGALRHRTIYHLRKQKGLFAETFSPEEIEGQENALEEITALFGTAKHSDESNGQRGRLIFNDVYLQPKSNASEELAHVKINPLTQGAVPGALFQEHILSKSYQWKMIVGLSPQLLEETEAIQAFELALNDLCEGLLPLGGGVNRGQGRFTGQIQKINF